MKQLILFFIVISYSSYSFGQKSTNKPVTTYLNAKWPQTPFILETAEYLVDESSILFWSFIEEVNKLDLKSYAKKNEKDKLDAIIQVTQSLLSPSQIDLLKFSLALRVYSPKIESFRQIALDRDVQKKGCKAAVEINNDLLCFPFKAEDIEKKAAEESSDVVYFDIDHSYNEIKKNVVILYAELGTEEFKSSHQILKTLADKGSISYVLRPYVQDPSEKKLRLSGFGVELQIKSTEYKAQDDTKLQEDLNVERSDEEGEEEVEGFLFGKLKTLYPDQKEKLNQLKAQLLESSQDMAPLRVWQLQHLSMQAAQRIMSHNETEQRMDSFINIAQNFPSVARSLIRTKVDDKLKKEIQKNQNLFRDRFDVSATDSSLSINGVLFEIESVDIFVLLDFIKSEQKVMERLHNLGLKGDTLANLQNLDMSENKQQYGIDIRDTAISFLNNIEKDKAYARWPSSIGELLRPTYPGMLRSIRKNLHNFVILADPTQKQSIDLLKTVHVFLGHVSPLRFGIVWSVKSDRKVTGFEDAGVALVCAFNYVVMSFDEEAEDKNIKGMKFILDFHAAHKNDVISPSDVTTYFKSKYKSEDLDDVFGADSEFDFGRQLAAQFVEKGSFKKFPQALFNGVPLPQEELTEESFEELLLMEVMKSTQNFQKALFSGEISDNHDPIDYLMDKPNIMPKINERILTTKQSKYINLSEAAPVKKSLLGISHEDFIKLSPSQMTDVIANSCRYITFRNDATIRPLTVWVVADFETEHGRDVLREAVKYTRESNEIRICALSNSENPGFLSKVVQVAQDTLPGAITRQLLSKILDPENIAKMDSGEKNWKDFHVKGLDKDAFESRLTNFKDHVLKSHMHYSSKVLGMPVGRSTVVANGRMLGVFLPEEVFSEDDFALLEKFSFSSIGEKISTVLNKETPPEDGDLSDLFMKVASVLQSKPQSRPRTPITVKSDQFSVIKLGPKDPSSPAFDILAICDPVSTGAQKIGPLIKAIHEVTNANVRIVLNAVDRHSEMPLKRFYRYILHTEPQFTKSGDIAQGPLAKFTGLSDTTIYTQSYDTPDNWLVEAVNSLHDLDNIKLEQVESGVHSEFELEYLLLEGHCFEQSTGNPPRGLQFTLGTRQNPLRVDTIVMANLGYFQLKASPGAMVLRLREGRSSDIYNIAGHEGTESPLGTSDIMVLINSFRSHLVKIKVAKKPSKADQDLLYDEEDGGGGIWETISSTFGNSDKEDAAEDEYINIFSVASGHLYERFLRIMMVSVRKHSSKPVKFWLIKNFLSPTFKNLLPVLANAFDFEYELVQYKWPRWLHQQTEKQRIIWGYKILFLDVLFPLHVKKIIFVDADQVVRADIKELHDLDLGGAPYGFVPFCDSRKEMDGFRFWKQGYWRSHLAGRKYHISALFVVDLKKFRQIAAGDRLRGQYQGLSQDPNSLSNLDQDLPNNMVHQVKIKSLPQDWLWCETWCDDSSKSSAKIIDLCNNPLTKEAKLNAAQRIISEWSSLDEDVKNSLKGQSQQKTDQKPKEDPKNVEL